MSEVVESFEAIVKFTPQSKMRMDGDVHTVHTNETLIRPLVRCGKCELRYKPLDDDVRNEIYCTFIGSTMRKDDFCSYGCADGEEAER